jgi:PAS domain S-box-containing protein
MNWSTPMRPPIRTSIERLPLAPPQTVEEAQRLLEDLCIHQAELEQQTQALIESQRQAEQQARLYAHLLMAVPVAVCRINERGVIHGPNEAMLALLGRELSGMEGQLLYRMGADEAQRRLALMAVQAAVARDAHEARGIWLSGGASKVLVDLHFSRSPQSMSGQNEWLLALVDQTGRHSEHLALQEVHEALKLAHAANQELALLADRSPHAVMICDSEMKIRWANPSFMRLTGYALHEALGQQPQVLLGTPDTEPQVLSGMAQALAQGQAVEDLRFKRRSKSGGIYWAEVSVLPIANEDGLIARHIVIEQDITDRIEADIERDALVRAEASHAAKTAFLSRMSHNMRTPLNAILGFSQLLLLGADTPPTDAQRVKLEIIRQAGQQLLTLVDHTLQLARLEHVHEHMESESVALAPLVSECAEWMRERAAVKGLRIDVEAPPLCALGNTQAVREIVQNLLSNAIKYSRGPGRVQITVGSQADGGLVSVAVKDEGVGIAQDDLPLIFQPFTRLEASSTMDTGHGIGLAISKRQAELMLGELSVQSELGRGSVFTLSLPSAQHPPLQPARFDDGADLNIALPPMRLLCIEDNAMNRLLIEAVFARFPQVSLAMSATLAEGLEGALVGRPDAILLDINLPDGSGLDLCRQLRADTEVSPQPLIVALSADALPEHIAQAMEAGADHYLVKPLQIARLLGLLQSRFKA